MDTAILETALAPAGKILFGFRSACSVRAASGQERIAPQRNREMRVIAECAREHAALPIEFIEDVRDVL